MDRLEEELAQELVSLSDRSDESRPDFERARKIANIIRKMIEAAKVP